ncbi:ATP-binding protein [Anaeromyxobacter paludicola]|uniref:histidine kinase n=1 Tax=Anaeromyxobacter paludicola TaxID=2918171 RepID=A0ABN6NEV1_9BACT|nr:ATP-binding protein [Anaeromyxobacter paludicola]BDG10833.1 hypothetical protein AMPC_39460 [Anaeromyxobacter paludicola]
MSSGAWAYLAAVGVSGLALALRVLTAPFFGGGVAYLTFYPAVMFAATLGGLGPGLVSTALCAAGAAAFVLPRAAHLLAPPAAASLAVFALMGIAMSLTAGLHRRSRQRLADDEKERAVRAREEELAAAEAGRLREQEEEARARAVQLEAVLDCIGDGVIVYDREGRTVRSSPAADAILGVPAEARAGPVADRAMRQYEVLTEDGRRQGPSEMAAVRAAVHGERIPAALYQVRAFGLAPRWLMISATPLFVGGRHTGAVLSLSDVTARKRAEEELRVVTRLYAVLSRVNEAIVRIRDERRLFEAVCRIVTEDGVFPLAWVGEVRGRKVVPAAAWGPAVDYVRSLEVEVDGPLGQGPTGTCVREGRVIINEDFDSNPATTPWREATLAHGLRASAAFPLRRAGEVVGALTFYAGEPGAFTAKQVQLLEALCADLSYALDALQHERLRAEAERGLREADRHKDEFLRMLSHELRNPLAPIRNSVQVLRLAEAGGEQAARAAGVIERQAAHLTRLVDDLLDVTRIASGKFALRRARLDLRDLVRRTADDFRAVMSERGLALEVALPATEAWVDADATRLTQILGNLLHNAAKFSERGETVRVELRSVDGRAELSVRDSGVGIDPELLPAIFDPFVQSDRTLARSEGGLGLGLALVRGIAELHGGTARGESPGPGRGAELVVTLPLAEAPAAPAPAPVPAAGRAPSDASRGRRVLVVDDNQDAARSMADVLELLGHAPRVAHDGPSALALARESAPEVVLCDIGLPGMSGYDVARALRADGGRDARLIAVTGYAQAEDVRRAVEAGFDAHLAKPCDLAELQRLLAAPRA